MIAGFDSMKSFFSVLNDTGINYLVLRNFENLLEPEFFVEGHGDLDLLCEDSNMLAKSVGAEPCPPESSNMRDDKIHYMIVVNSQPVSLDLRQVGDGYYCEEWERDLLEHRVKKKCFFVTNEENYFFTLIYHAILQKRSFAEDYRIRLIQMSEELGLVLNTYNEKGFIRLLEDFMRKKGYRFTFSNDYMVPNRFHLVDKKLVDRDYKLKWTHFKFDLKVLIIEKLVRIKHALRL